MKKLLRKIQVILVVFIILIIGLEVKSMATDYTCDLTIEADKEQIKAGETVTLTIKVSNIQAGEGIAIYNTLLEYPTDIFDIIIQSDSSTKWSNMTIENSISFTRENYENNSDDQEIAQILLTAKNNATVGKQTITLKNNEFSGTQGFTVADVSKEIEIIQDEDNGNNITENISPDRNITQYGKIIGLIICCVIILAIIFYIFYVKYKKSI